MSKENFAADTGSQLYLAWRDAEMGEWFGVPMLEATPALLKVIKFFGWHNETLFADSCLDAIRKARDLATAKRARPTT